MKTTVAIIGCGRIAETAHLPALSKLSDVKIKYVCDIIGQKALKAKEKYGALHAVTDYNEALRDSEVDAVYVLTPNFAHYRITMDALNAGKHVFCEKPITVNYPLAVEMAQLANSKGLTLNIGVCNRFHKSVTEIRELAKSGKLGNVYHVYCNFRAKRSIPGLGGAFTTKAESGGGVLIDWGIHFFDLILFILDGAKIKSVTANTYSEMAKNIPDYKYETMWAGPSVLDGINDVEDFVTGYIRTDKATISFNGAWAQNIDDDSKMYVDFLGDKAGARLTYGGHYRMFDSDLNVFQSEGDIPLHYECEDREFIKIIREGGRSVSHIDCVLESQKLLDAIYESAEKNREVYL